MENGHKCAQLRFSYVVDSICETEINGCVKKLSFKSFISVVVVGFFLPEMKLLLIQMKLLSLLKVSD